MWDDRNLLYSRRFDLGTAVLIPDCNMRQVVTDGMEELSKKVFPGWPSATQDDPWSLKLRG